MSKESSVPDRLRALLAARGFDWAAPIEHHATLGSTSDLLKDRAREGAPEWSAVLADAQSGGRGRQGRTWVSPPGNLYLSFLLRPSSPGPHWRVLPLMTGVAVAEALEELGLAVALKWPNDVLAGDRKLAGILVEGTSSGAGLDSAVVGVGVNVAADPVSAATDLRGTATSVHAETGGDVSPVEVAAAVLARMTVWYHALGREGAPRVLEAWRKRSVAWWGRPVEARSGETVVRGILRDLDASGGLVLEDAEGRRTTLHSGEVRELRPTSP